MEKNEKTRGCHAIKPMGKRENDHVAMDQKDRVPQKPNIGKFGRNRPIHRPQSLPLGWHFFEPI